MSALCSRAACWSSGSPRSGDRPTCARAWLTSCSIRSSPCGSCWIVRSAGNWSFRNASSPGLDAGSLSRMRLASAVLGGASSRPTAPCTGPVWASTWPPMIESATVCLIPWIGSTIATASTSVIRPAATPAAGSPSATISVSGGSVRTRVPSQATPRPTNAWTAACTTTSTSRKLPNPATPWLTPSRAYTKPPIGPNATNAAASRTPWATTSAAPASSTGSTKLKCTGEEYRLQVTSRRERLAAARLYAITPEADPEAVERLVGAWLRGGADVVQLRQKRVPRGQLLALAERCAAACAAAGALFVVNDHVDVATLSGADGVHVGPDDLTVAAARRAAGADLLVGASASTPDAGREAERDGADYLGTGPAYATPLKTEKRVIGPAGRAAVAAR